MTAFSIAAIMFIAFLIIDRVQNIYTRRIQIEVDEEMARLEVFKIISKEDLHLIDDPDKIFRWISSLLDMIGYSEIEKKELNEDSAFNYICTYRGKKVYVACKIGSAREFEAPINTAAVQKLVGAMVGDRIRRGLIITAGTLTEEAIKYLDSLPVSYKIKVLDGAALMENLHHIRQKELKPLLQAE